ncbi:carboxypeptidase regulatory-like domain-containing protein [Myxococcus stipitatus]|uniref:MSCRAMM family protein n=1 Tax=Myxococcus stipitatus TaxID=83455 RepID=UPI001F185020|nr:carboxypeptidase regulatory-like domain-containing protein [Myxococcus stipitatus]MCE9668598.1 carboxypeptidase regulatory-like domain-containing protein [Myxococcus stipitatus]
MHKQFLAASVLVAVGVGIAVAFLCLRETSARGSASSRLSLGARAMASLFSPPPSGARSLRGTVVSSEGARVGGVEVTASVSIPDDTLSSIPCSDRRPDLSLSSLSCEGEPRQLLLGRIEGGLGAARVVARTTSNADGTFILDDLPEGSVTLWALSHEGAHVEPSVSTSASSVTLTLGPTVMHSGQVVDEDGRPLRGTRVTLYFARHSRFFETTTDAQGRFSLGPLPEGDYGRVIRHPGLPLLFETLPSLKAEDESEEVKLLKPRRLAGQVFDKEQPVADAEVVITETGQSARTGRDGAFAFENMPRGSYHLTASASSRRGHARINVGKDDLAAEPGVRIELRPRVSFSGTVKTPEGHPIPGVQVEASSSDEKDQTLTDSQGHFAFESLAPEEHTVTLRASGYADKRLREVQPATTPTQDWELEPSVVIRGQVTDADGHPIPRAIVQLTEDPVEEDDSEDDGATPLSSPEKDDHDAPDTDLHEFRVTRLRVDEEGRFAFERSESGRYALRVDANQHIPLNTVVDAPASDLRLVPQLGASVEGIVVDGDGAPLSDVRLALSTNAAEPRDLATLSSGPTGHFTFRGLPPGGYVLHARFDEGDHHATTHPIEVPDARTVETTVRLDTGSGISGIAVDTSGRPLPEVTIQATAFKQAAEATTDESEEPGESSRRDPPSSSEAVTDGRGRFAVKHLGKGSCELEVSLRGHELVSVSAAGVDSPGNAEPLLVTAGATDVKLTFRYIGGVRGRVVREDGTPVTDLSINGYEAKDPEGKFQWEFGDWERATLLFSAPGLMPLQRVVAPTPGQLTDLGDLVMKPRQKLRGRVSHARTGEPIEEARVQLVEGSSGHEVSNLVTERFDTLAFTEPDGSFELDGYAGDDLALQVQSNGAPEHLHPLGSGATWADVRILPGATLTGTLTDAAGKTLQASSLLLLGSTFGKPDTERIDDEPPEVRRLEHVHFKDGLYEVNEIAPGTYQVIPRVEPRDGTPPIRFKPRSVTLALGERVRLDFQEQRGNSKVTLVLLPQEGVAEDERVTPSRAILVAGDIPLPDIDERLDLLRDAASLPLQGEEQQWRRASASNLSAGRYTYFLMGSREKIPRLVIHREVVDVGSDEDRVHRIHPRWNLIDSMPIRCPSRPETLPDREEEKGW